MKTPIKLFREHQTSVVTILLGAGYFWFLAFIHDSTLGDFQFFVQQPVDPLYFIDTWNIWSSRLFIESAVNFFSKHMWAWQFLTIVLGAILFWSLARLLRVTRVWQAVLLFSLILLINVEMLATAGIFATTINYLWPLACFAFVCAAVFRPFQNNKLRLLSNFIIWPLMLFAVCSEQVAALGVLLGLGYVVYLFYSKQKIPWHIWGLLLFAVAGLLNTLIAPGNDVRTTDEIGNWWPDFATMTLVEKVIIGAITTLSRLFLVPEIPAVLLAIVLAVLACVKKNVRAFAAILPALIVVMLFFAPQTAGQPGTYVRQVNYFNEMREKSIYFAPNNLPDRVDKGAYILLFSLLLISILITIYLLYGKSKKTLTLLWLLGSGLAISLAVSFSPTLFASSTRTLYPFVIILVGINFVIVQDVVQAHFGQRRTARGFSEQ